MMDRLLRSLIAVGLCLISTLSADEYHETLHKKLLYSLYGKEVTPFALISIPKSGTHLMINVLHHMAHAVPHWHAGFDPDFSPYYSSLWQDKNCYNYLCMHFCIHPALENLRNNIKLKRIICIRDLRDICVSMVYHIRKKGWAGLNANNPKGWNAFHQLSFDEQLLFVINYECYSPVPGDQWDLSMVTRQAIQYCKELDVLVCPYESLVGEKGGGTQKAQLRTLARISQFLKLAFSEKELIEISSKIYGNEHAPFGKKEGFTTFESTYRNAKIGSWKEVFKEEHKEAFKNKLGWALIALGYEKNNNW